MLDNLDSLRVITATLNHIEVFQVEGIRQMLKVTASYIDRNISR